MHYTVVHTADISSKQNKQRSLNVRYTVSGQKVDT